MSITVFNKSKVVVTDYLGSQLDWTKREAIADKNGIKDIDFTVTTTDTVNNLKVVVTDSTGKKHNFTRKLTKFEELTSITHKNPVITKAMAIENNMPITQINQLNKIASGVQASFDIKPVNGDMVCLDTGAYGLLFDNYIHSNARYYTTSTITPFTHIIPADCVIGNIAANKAKLEAELLKSGSARFTKVAQDLQPTTKHQPGCIYLDTYSNTEAYLYLGKGVLTDINNLDTKTGHVYIRFIVKKFTEADLKHARADYTMTDLKSFIANTIQLDQSTITANIATSYTDFLDNYNQYDSMLRVEKSLSKLLLVDQLFDLAPELQLATADNQINWLFSRQ